MSYISGQTVTLSSDLTSISPFDSVVFEIGQSNRKLYQFKYPATEGYKTVSKNGNVYSFILSSDDTANFLGVYGVEMTWVSSSITNKAQCYGLEFISEMK